MIINKFFSSGALALIKLVGSNLSIVLFQCCRAFYGKLLPPPPTTTTRQEISKPVLQGQINHAKTTPLRQLFSEIEENNWKKQTQMMKDSKVQACLEILLMKTKMVHLIKVQ